MALPTPGSRPTAAGRQALARRLGLPYSPAMQDWEWEVADPARFDEFLAAATAGDLGDDERVSLAEVLVQCVEALGLPTVEPSRPWRAVAALLLARPDLHADTVRYWSCLELCGLGDGFGVSGPMRTVWAAMRGEAAVSEPGHPHPSAGSAGAEG